MRARIYQTDRSSTQSGKARAGQWTLAYDTPQGPVHDPLTGWPGSGDTRGQISLSFPTLEAATAYAARKGLAADIIPAAPRSLKIQAYSDNFR